MEIKSVIFLDRDGVINLDKGYVGHPDDVVILPKVKEALVGLKELEYLLIVVSNQSGVARGYFSEEDVINVNKKINELLVSYNGVSLIDAFYYCPHLLGSNIKKYNINCNCRKPSPGLILKAINDYKEKDINIDVSTSYMIGDKKSDVLAGINAGISNNILISDSDKEFSIKYEVVSNLYEFYVGVKNNIW